MTDREDRIRQLAYFLWLEEGCPQGEAERHWQAAEVLFESEPVERKEREGEPPGEPAGKAQTAAGNCSVSRRRNLAGSSTPNRPF